MGGGGLILDRLMGGGVRLAIHIMLHGVGIDGFIIF